MAKHLDHTPDNEAAFEQHFCEQLNLNNKYRLRFDSKITIDKEVCIYFDDLEEFLLNTQGEKLQKYQSEYGMDWKKYFKIAFHQALVKNDLFQLLQNGITLGDYDFDLRYALPNRDGNKNAQALYEKNRFTVVRQWYFGSVGESQNKSIDIVICLNGFAIVTIELKNQGTSGTYEDAIDQYLDRDLTLPLFTQPFLHIVADNERAMMATTFSEPATVKDFRHFNKELYNVIPNKDEYPVHYLYHDILQPDKLMNFLDSYLFSTKKGKWIFPRYHQQRATNDIVEHIKEEYKKTGILDLRYLIQHSTGSGKSMTIVWLAQNLRNAFVDDEKLFDSIVVLTDRVNLDDQISKDFQNAISTSGIAEYAEETADLKQAIEDNKKVIISTIHKFKYLKDLSDQKGKRICVIIDEAHRSQEGKLHQGVTDTFSASDDQGVEKAKPDIQDQFINKIERKEFPNLAFVALTATPTDKTLEHFGKQVWNEEIGKSEWAPFDSYSMDQAIAEGYIMDVAKHIYSYDTLYKLNKKVDTEKEYLPMMVRKALRQKAYENDEIIKEKCNRIIHIFKNESAKKIKHKAKAMIVTSSRLAAVKYKFYLNEEIKKQELSYQALVAFSGSIKFSDDDHTEDSLNKSLNPKSIKIEDVFEKNDNIRFLIVANKFQTGFSEALLHTMFVDKPLRGKTAVQTLSRLNRIHPDKIDTLVVDFTGSYEEIMKAYQKYQSDVTTLKTSDPEQLYELKDKLITYGVFTNSDIDEVAKLGRSKDKNDMPAIAGITHCIKRNFEKELTREKRDEVRTLVNRYVGIFKYINSLFRIPDNGLKDFQLFLIYLRHKLINSDFKNLMKELEQVHIADFSVLEKEQKPVGENAAEPDGNKNVTRIKQTKTVNEVIEEINLKYHEELGEEGAVIVSNFFNKITADSDLKTTIKNNLRETDTQIFDLIKEKLQDTFRDEVVNNSDDYGNAKWDNIFSKIGSQAFQVLKNMVTAA